MRTGQAPELVFGGGEPPHHEEVAGAPPAATDRCGLLGALGSSGGTPLCWV